VRPSWVAARLRPALVIPGYTGQVKTAISLPDATFEQATKKARELGISRSEFFARAAEVYLDELAEHSLTSQIDEALDTAGTDESSSAATAAGRRRLAADDW
jgi:metal-responsive CopG/Arc/MetJ family transcriptional regulator